MAIVVTLHSLNGADEKQTEIIEQSISLLESALNHSEFTSRVRDADYTETRFRRRGERGEPTSVNKDRIVEILTGGIERDTESDEEIDLFINLKELPAPTRTSKGTVGQTTTGRQPITTAYWFINGCVEDGDNISPARHFIHEWLHVAGFVHYPDNSAREDVPYVVGRIVENILSEESRGLKAKQSDRMRQLLDEADEEVHEE